ncbi:DUF4087 domain-containing protein [Paraburkholderia domus]|uniref:DUF4087 domain-containing protein n=1 Tax=Paraburkholderia domus TaxID=2793075 RepID=UPI001B24960E|nr:DUF4087 domain-containing protein [Paraburkholderia domus]CAE6768237.1 hypothetical protein R75483_03885 [Paraburkholderia domus]
MTPSKRFVSILTTVVLSCFFAAACSKRLEYSRLDMQYKQQCFGDMTVECRDLQIRRVIAAEEANLEQVKSIKDRYIECRGEADYDELQSLIHKHIDYLEDLRPNFFARHFMASREIELPDDDFPGRSRLQDLGRPSCHPQPATQEGSTADYSSQPATASEPASEPDTGLATRVPQPEQPSSASAATAIPAAASAVTANTAPVDATSSLTADGPAARRCGWIENNLPSSLTLRDRDGTWNIVGATHSGEFASPDGFDQMPSTSKVIFVAV